MNSAQSKTYFVALSELWLLKSWCDCAFFYYLRFKCSLKSKKIRQTNEMPVNKKSKQVYDVEEILD